MNTAFGVQDAAPDITKRAFDPETIAMFIRVCGLNRDLDREDAVQVEATLLRRPLTDEESADMELEGFTNKRKYNQDKWWWAMPQEPHLFPLQHLWPPTPHSRDGLIARGE